MVKKSLFLSMMFSMGFAVSNNVYTCGIFDSPLVSQGNIKINNGGNYVHICGTNNVKAKGFNGVDNGNYCSTDFSCGGQIACHEAPPPINIYTPVFIESKKTNSVSNDLQKFTFENNNYADAGFTKSDIVFHFSPTKKDESGRYYMTFGNWKFNKNNIDLYFDKSGDYYFDGIKFSGNNITWHIPKDVKVRVFIKNNLIFNENNITINKDGDPSNLLLYTGGELSISPGGDGIYISGYIYSQGNVIIQPNADVYIKGGLSSKGNLTINPNSHNITVVYGNDSKNLGYPKCPLCYALNNNGNWVSRFSFFNSNVTFNLPREMAIINNSEDKQTLYNLVVKQNESNPSWVGGASPMCFKIVDEDKNTVTTDINASATYKFKLSSIQYYKTFTTKSSNGQTCITPSFDFDTILNTEINVSALYGDYSPGGYDNYYAIDTYAITGSFNGNEDLNYYANYFDSNGRYYSVKLDYCDIPGNLLTPTVTGSLDAWDTDHNESDRNITTKIVNQEFNLTLAFLGDKVSRETDVNYSLYDDINKKVIYNWNTFDIEDQEKNASFNVNRAYKDVRVIFKACCDYNGTDYKFYDLNQCNEDCVNNNELNHKCFRYFKSSDNFAIRPYGFMVFGDNQYKRAGEEFNITVKAVDEANYNKNYGRESDIVGVADYNATVGSLNFDTSFYVPTDDQTRQMNKDVYGIDDTNRSRVAYCPDSGTFTAFGNDFTNGDDNVTLKYSESGILTLKVSEKYGSEFAKVDEDDTPDAQRYIKPAEKILDKNDISKTDILLFIPYQFVTKGVYTSTTGSNWVYVSNDVNKSFSTHIAPKMAGLVQYVITAENKNGQILKNYTKRCFPDVSPNAPTINGLKLNTTFDLFLDTKLNSDKNATLYIYAEGNNSKSAMWIPSHEINITKGDNLIKASINQLEFENGIGVVNLFMNTKKVYNKYASPIHLEVKDINTSTSWMNNAGATNVFVPANINKSLEYRYGATFVNDITVYNKKDANLTVYFKYWDGSKGWVLNKDHNSTAMGEVNITKSYYPKNNLQITAESVKDGTQKLNISSNKNPYSAKIHLAIPSWLWYHPLAKPYRDPSSTNLDCLTHPCMKVIFNKTGNGWAGVGTNSTKMNEHNVTINLNLSPDINATKHEIKKLNW